MLGSAPLLRREWFVYHSPRGLALFVVLLRNPRQNRFGEALGEKVWESCNAVFDRLPLAGVIDQDIFCVHGGIPRPLAGSSSRIQVSC